MWLQVINKVKVTHQGQGQSKLSTSLQILCSPCSLQAGGLHSTEMLLVLFMFNNSPYFAFYSEMEMLNLILSSQLFATHMTHQNFTQQLETRVISDLHLTLVSQQLDFPCIG